MDDMVEYFPPVATSVNTEVKEEHQSDTEDGSSSPAKKMRVDALEIQESAGMVDKYYFPPVAISDNMELAKKESEDTPAGMVEKYYYMPMNPMIENEESIKSYPDIIKEALLLAKDNLMSMDEIRDYVLDKYPSKTTSVTWKKMLRDTISRNRGNHFQMFSGKVGLRSRSSPVGSRVVQYGDGNQDMLVKDVLKKEDIYEATKASGIDENDFDYDMDVSNEAHNQGFDPDQDEKKVDLLPSKCHICDKDLSQIKKPRGHIWNCVSKGKRGPMCPKCGKHFPYRTSHNHMLRHTEICDPIGKMCKSDH